MSARFPVPVRLAESRLTRPNGIRKNTVVTYAASEDKSSSSSSSDEKTSGPQLAGDVPGFGLRRYGTFSCIIGGYSCYYLTRKGLESVNALMIADPALGMDITQMGILTSIFPIAYGVSKFVSGNLSDQFSPRLMLGGGLLMTGLSVTAFGMSSSLMMFSIFYAFNGMSPLIHLSQDMQVILRYTSKDT
jgi:sugar phosphate permease